MQIHDILAQQRLLYATGQTKPLAFRVEQLKKLKSALIRHEAAIKQALYHDLRKSSFEAYATEWYLVMQELTYALKHIRTWVQNGTTKYHWLFFPARSYIHPDPRGCVLIIAPWNYPFQLTLIPLIGALAAGNCAVIKPSEYVPHSTSELAKIIKEIFDPTYVSVVQADATQMPTIIEQPWDYIFFTGSTTIGKKIMTAAATNLTPLTLELGGKSPSIVHNDASLACAAKRIVWGKFLNAGQSCIAPDYLLVHAAIYNQFIEQLRYWITQCFGTSIEHSKNYARIINHHHFDRLSALLQGQSIIIGGQCNRDDLYIEPTVLLSPYAQSPIMSEEIFGPLLPIMIYEDLNQALHFINQKPKPLALYLFSNNKTIQNYCITNAAAGSVCINDVLIQGSLPNLPFGGIGMSGFGQYHGKKTFEIFSHFKPIIANTCTIDLPFRYPSQSTMHQWIIKLTRWLVS